MGGWVIALAAIACLVVAFGLRTKLPALAVGALLAATSAALAWGVLSLRPDPSTGERILAIGAMAVLGPAHAWVVLGRFGPRRRWSR